MISRTPSTVNLAYQGVCTHLLDPDRQLSEHHRGSTQSLEKRRS